MKTLQSILNYIIIAIGEDDKSNYPLGIIQLLAAVRLLNINFLYILIWLFSTNVPIFIKPRQIALNSISISEYMLILTNEYNFWSIYVTYLTIYLTILLWKGVCLKETLSNIFDMFNCIDIDRLMTHNGNMM